MEIRTTDNVIDKDIEDQCPVCKNADLLSSRCISVTYAKRIYMHLTRVLPQLEKKGSIRTEEDLLKLSKDT
jgi:hypothetical protein